MSEQPTQTAVYLKNDRGTVVKKTDPKEVARLKKETSYQEIPAEEGAASFAGKRAVFSELDKGFGGQLSEAAKTQ